MKEIPAVDLPITDLIEGKKVVIYTANNKGEFPNTFMKTFIPSSIPIDAEWFVGYTPIIIDGFNMLEIPDDIAKGLQSFNIINHSMKRYNQYNQMNENNEKLEIIMSDEDVAKQIEAKKYLLQYELVRLYDIKIKDLYTSYGLEKDTWAIQLEEAQSFKKDNMVDTPFLTNIAAIRKVSIETLVNKILSKSDEYKRNISTLIGNKQLFTDRIKSATTNEELNIIFDEIKIV